MQRHLSFCPSATLACGDKEAENTADTGSDADTDVDTDADTGADTDADTDADKMQIRDAGTADTDADTDADTTQTRTQMSTWTTPSRAADGCRRRRHRCMERTRRGTTGHGWTEGKPRRLELAETHPLLVASTTDAEDHWAVDWSPPR